MKRPFFSFDLRQPVNQWLCFALIGLMAFWVVLYYFVNRTSAFANDYVQTTYAAAKSR